MGRAGTAARPAGGIEEYPSGVGGIAFEGAAIRQGLTAQGRRQGDLGFFPAQLLALAPVGLGRIRIHDRHHAAVHLGDDPFRPRCDRPLFLRRGALEDVPGVSQGHSPNDAFAEQNTVVFNQLVHRARKGNVGGKVGHGPLQRA